MALTQATIAQKLGISRRAVGFALSDDTCSQKQVGAQTRRQILKTARQLGYRPHRQAQLLRGKKSGVIGIIKTTGMMQAGVERSFFASQAIQAAGYGLLVNELLWEEMGERRAVDAMLDAIVEGVLLLGLANPDDAVLAELRRLSKAKIPVVAVGGVCLPETPSVTTDHRQGMRDLTNHLLTLGYRRLILVSPVSPEKAAMARQTTQTERLTGFRDAADAAGLSETQARVMHQTNSVNWSDCYAPGQAVIRRLIERRELPEALLCSNDDWAMGALAACADAGLKVPDDIAITGFDNTTLGQYARPALTTVAQPTEAVARHAVELLLRQMRGERILAGEALVKLPCQVVVRQSCGDKTTKERTQPCIP